MSYFHLYCDEDEMGYDLWKHLFQNYVTKYNTKVLSEEDLDEIIDKYCSIFEDVNIEDKSNLLYWEDGMFLIEGYSKESHLLYLPTDWINRSSLVRNNELMIPLCLYSYVLDFKEVEPTDEYEPGTYRHCVGIATEGYEPFELYFDKESGIEYIKGLYYGGDTSEFVEYIRSNNRCERDGYPYLNSLIKLLELDTFTQMMKFSSKS